MSAEEIRVQFVTPLERYRVTDSPFAVPAKLNAAGLSNVICHLLALETPTTFDFLIDGHLLRTSLRKHLLQHGISEV
jgi:ribosome biogenesis protein YTM1